MARVRNENGTGGSSPRLDRERAVCDLPIEVDALAIEPRRRPGLQPAPLEAERLQRFGEVARRRLAGASRRVLLGADVNQPVQERAGRDDERAARVRIAVLQRQSDDAAVLDENPCRPCR